MLDAFSYLLCPKLFRHNRRKPSQQPRNKKYAKPRKKCAGTPVCYLCDQSSSRFRSIITQKLWHLFLPNLHILVSSYTVPYIPNLKEITPAVPEIRVPETRQIFFVFFFFFFFAPNNKSVRKLCSLYQFQRNLVHK